MYKSDTQEYYSIVTCNICCVVLWWKCKYSYTYDAIGNPTTYRGASLAFNGRQLTSYNDGANAISYTYDASGLRASKTVNGETTVYQYVGDKLYYEQRADGSKHYYFYDSYGNLAKIYRHTSLGQKVYNVVTNAQGDVIALYDYAGVLVCTYEYDAWGNLTFARDSAGNIITSQNHIAFLNPIRYRGYYYDSEIGMYYLQSRYYDPDTGRFINADGYITTGQGVLSYNMYAYCLNNPVMYSDPSGYYSWDEFWEDVEEYFERVCNINQQQQALEDQIRQEQMDIVGDVIDEAWDTYVLSNELDAQRQYEQDMAVIDFWEDRFSTPEKTSNTLDAIIVACGALAAVTKGYQPVSIAFEIVSIAVGAIKVIYLISQEE